MSGLLPRKPPVKEPGSGPRVLDVMAEETAALVTAVSSDTARRLLLKLYNEPATQSDLWRQVGTLIQNVGYHLERLVDAVIGQCRSEKCREMGVYVPADAPLIFGPRKSERAPDTWDTTGESRTVKAAIQSSD